MKKYGLISRLIPILLISMVLGGTAYSWNARRLAGNAMPMPFGVGMSVVLSGSMEPTLSVNDLVFVKEQPSYEPQDIVVFQDGTHLVIHRILAIDEVKAVTKGDANNVADEPIFVTQIKGKLVASIPIVGVLVRFLKTLPGLLLVLGAAVYLLIRSRYMEKAAANEELDDIRRQIEELRQRIDEVEAAAEPEEPPAEQETQSNESAAEPETKTTEPERPETAEPETKEEYEEGSSPDGEGSSQK